jgi:hypothetical protein
MLTKEKNLIEKERKMPILEVFFERQILMLQPNRKMFKITFGLVIQQIVCRINNLIRWNATCIVI